MLTVKQLLKCDLIVDLLGTHEPQGDTNLDKLVMQNLELTEELLNRVIDNLADNVKFKNRPEASIQEIAEYSEDILKAVRTLIDCRLEKENNNGSKEFSN